jgi:hypothetical protein
MMLRVISPGIKSPFIAHPFSTKLDDVAAKPTYSTVRVRGLDACCHAIYPLRLKYPAISLNMKSQENLESILSADHPLIIAGIASPGKSSMLLPILPCSVKKKETNISIIFPNVTVQD